MRRLFISLALVGCLAFVLPASAATGKVIKVLPHFLDLKGRHTKSPSLSERWLGLAVSVPNPVEQLAI